MIKRVLDLLKNNPVIIAYHLMYELLIILIVVFLYPNNINQFGGYDNFNYAAYFMMMGKLFTACGLIFILSLFFMPGFGHMLSETVTIGKTSVQAFVEGINRFFVRMLLLTLLGTAAAIAFSIMISIILVPVAIFLTMGGGAAGLQSISLAIMLFTLVIIIFIIPFVVLCFPAILMDDVSVTQGIKNGAKAGVKNYWRLIAILFSMYLPIIVYEIFYFNSASQGVIITPAYIVLLIICGIISLFLLPIMFLIYKEYRVNNQ